MISVFRAGLHDSDGEGAGLSTLACLFRKPPPAGLTDAYPNADGNQRDPAVFQEQIAGDWLIETLHPAHGVTGNQLGGRRRTVLHGDVGEAQSFTTVEDATTIDRHTVNTGTPYLPGRMPPAAITGELGGFPT